MTKLLSVSLAVCRVRIATVLGLAACGLVLGNHGGASAATGTLEAPADPGTETKFEAWLPRALGGDPVAAFAIARAYTAGGARPEDFSEAAAWFRKAADLGHPAAPRRLGSLYAKGQGVPRDYVRAHAWFALAADNPDQGLARDQAEELRGMMAAFLTPEQRREAERLAVEWRKGRINNP